MTNWKHRWTHYLGVSASLLCLIHCLTVPVLLVIVPTVAGMNIIELNFMWEVVFVSLSIVSIYTILQMHRTHKKFSPALPVAFVGVIVLIGALFLEHEAAHFVLPIGSVLILVAHMLNLKYCSSHSNCHKSCSHSSAVPGALQ